MVKKILFLLVIVSLLLCPMVSGETFSSYAYSLMVGDPVTGAYTFSELRDSATGYINPNVIGNVEVGVFTSYSNGLDAVLYRSVMTFDTTSMPENSDITSAKLYGSFGYQQYGLDYQYFGLTRVYPVSYTSGSSQDYLKTRYTGRIGDYYPYSSSVYIDIDPDLITPGEYSSIGIRDWHDLESTAPSWVSHAANYLLIQSPYLLLEYYNSSPESIPVSVWEKYSYAVLVNQAVTVKEILGGAEQTKTSHAGETIFFDVVPGSTYWFNASRPGYFDFNQTYTIPVDPPQYHIYMSKTLSPVPGMNYTHFSVIDQTNGGMQQNARILLSDGQSKLTNSAGYSWFLVNQSTPYTYTVSKTGYMNAVGSFNITADTDILVSLQPPNVPTVIPSWTPITVPTTGTGPITTLSAQQRKQNVEEGIDVWYRNISFISQFLFLLFILGGLGLVAGGMDRRRRR